MNARKRIAGLALAAALLAQPVTATPAWAHAGQNPLNEFAAGFACFVISPVYGAFKVGLGLLGGLVGSFAWALSGGDTATASKVWDPTMKGTYVIAPDHLRGEKPIRFIGSHSH